MKEIKLSQGKFALVDNEDYERINKFKWCACKHRNTFYSHRIKIIDGKRIKIRMHRFIMGLTDSKILIDHRDGNGLNNLKANLRICTSSQNSMNRMPYKNCSSKYKGVYWNKNNKKWVAEIGIIGERRLYLGLFNSEIEAAYQYDLKAKELHGEFARLNFNL